MRTTEALDLDPADRWGPAIGRPDRRQWTSTRYAGTDQDGRHISITVRVTRAPQNVDTAQTRQHGPVPPDALTLAFQAQAVRTGARDIDSSGAWAGDALRSIVDPGSDSIGPRLDLTEAERRELAEIADRWHLNDMHAGCDHQAADHGRTTAERLDQTPPCPETGYRYGNAWLFDIVPGYVVDTLTACWPGFAEALADLDADAAQ